MKRFVYKPNYAKLLVSMGGEKKLEIDELAKRINANSGHLRIVLEQWHKEGIIHKDKPGREYKIRLTEKGEAISRTLAILIQIDENFEEYKASQEKEAEKEKAENKNKDMTAEPKTETKCSVCGEKTTADKDLCAKCITAAEKDEVVENV